MKAAFLILVCLFQVNTPSFQDIVKQSETQNKPILLVFSGSDWCANCIRLKTNVFDQEDFRTMRSEDFLMYTADFPRTKKAVEDQKTLDNEMLADRFNPKGQFPLVLLLDTDQNILKKSSGKFNTVDEFRNWLSL